jgi:Uma2 family endonuclease
MKPLLETPPRTIMEVYKSLPEGTLAELIDNIIYMSPSPVASHQKLLLKIAFQLNQYLEDKGGEVLVAPFDIYLDETSNAVQPDIVVILKENKGRLEKNGHFHGSPDMLVEILSPGNKEYDLIRKKDLYEKFGVKEYWIVDPETKLALGYALENSKYSKVSEKLAVINSTLIGAEIIF